MKPIKIKLSKKDINKFLKDSGYITKSLLCILKTLVSKRVGIREEGDSVVIDMSSIVNTAGHKEPTLTIKYMSYLNRFTIAYKPGEEDEIVDSILTALSKSYSKDCIIAGWYLTYGYMSDYSLSKYVLSKESSTVMKNYIFNAIIQSGFNINRNQID